MVQFSSVHSLSRVQLCDPMNRSTPGLSVHHQLPEFTETHVHRVSDAIQPSHPLPSPSPPVPNPSQHQSLFQWVNSSREVAEVLEFHLQHHSLQRTTRADLLQNYLNSKTEMISHEVFLVKWNDRCESLSRVPAFYYYLLILFNFKLKTSKIFENVDVDLAIIELLLLILFWLQVSIYY